MPLRCWEPDSSTALPSLRWKDYRQGQYSKQVDTICEEWSLESIVSQKGFSVSWTIKALSWFRLPGQMILKGPCGTKLMFSSHLSCMFIFMRKWKTQTVPGSCGLFLRWSTVIQKQTVRTDNKLVKNARTTLTSHISIAATFISPCCHKERAAVQIIRFRCCLLDILWSLCFFYGHYCTLQFQQCTK